MKQLDQHKKNKYLRRALLGALVFFVAMVQNVPWLPVVFGAQAFPLVPLVVAIAFFDQPVSAVLYGAIAGVLWDAMSPVGGYHGFYLTIVAFACAIGMRYFFNRNFVTITITSLSAVGLYLLARWFIGFATMGFPSAEIIYPLWRYMLPSFGYTMLFTPLCFLLVGAIIKRTAKRQQKVIAE